MTMAAFDVLFPDLARSESRAITATTEARLPLGSYLFREWYCVEPRCDCRRVLLHVWHAERRRQVATLNDAFEPAAPPYEDEPQLFVDPLNPQSDLSYTLKDIVGHMLATDFEYRARLERHYTMWKDVVDDPAHPMHGKIRTKHHDDPTFRSAFPMKAGPNEPCSCGSGKKYKKCCRS